MFLFQLYGRYVQTNIPVLLPLMVSAISIPGPQNVSPNWRNHFVDLKGAQVKTVSFLTYLLRSFAEYIRPHEESISKSIVNLLVTCPDSVSIRKELLVATRHVLSTDFRRGLYPLIDTLLEERSTKNSPLKGCPIHQFRISSKKIWAGDNEGRMYTQNNYKG
ncbi:probable transcription-associated protein 1 isoform X2 [Amborella trichopoda]|uniref:probable transcription-associated protein 1 isoform X2 n=1 Tax=Amborella trichopoda TaxID=13333 RepID=UPI0009BD9EFD|nr:probable transcription-associated protein 1 isoform X2 [Amborella trichopoda]|eukprot:XP_020517833.1 probable transcription-associated protein 1 isoform X2 [Amborella trichopoda]